MPEATDIKPVCGGTKGGESLVELVLNIHRRRSRSHEPRDAAANLKGPRRCGDLLPVAPCLPSVLPGGFQTLVLITADLQEVVFGRQRQPAATAGGTSRV